MKDYYGASRFKYFDSQASLENKIFNKLETPEPLDLLLLDEYPALIK
jgi:hypothetical protein